MYAFLTEIFLFFKNHSYAMPVGILMFSDVAYMILNGEVLLFNIARCIANSICLVARKLESHCTLQILNE